MGEALQAFSPEIWPLATRSQNSGPASHRSSSAMTEDLPEELHGEFFEWLRRRNNGAIGPQPARRGGLTPIQTSRRHEASAAAKRHRFLNFARLLPLTGTIENSLNNRAQWIRLVGVPRRDVAILNAYASNSKREQCELWESLL